MMLTYSNETPSNSPISSYLGKLFLVGWILAFSLFPWYTIVPAMIRRDESIPLPILVFFILWSAPTFLLGVGLIADSLKPYLILFIEKMKPSVEYIYGEPEPRKVENRDIRKIVSNLGWSVFLLAFGSLPWLFVGFNLGYVPGPVIVFNVIWSAIPVLAGLEMKVDTIKEITSSQPLKCVSCEIENDTNYNYCRLCGTVLQQKLVQ